MTALQSPSHPPAAPRDSARRSTAVPSPSWQLDATCDGADQRKDVCLLSMPYPIIDQPSVALGLLQSALERRDISTRSWFPCLWFAEEVGLDVISLIAGSKQEFLIGEWTFAGAAFPDFHPDHDAYLDVVLSAAVTQGLSRRNGFRGDARAALKMAREAAPGFVDRVARRVLAVKPKIVGCTSTFFQHSASLALLRRIRELDETVATVMGGANCEGPMGVATRRCFPWVDYVVSGEGDTLFPDLCEALLAHGRELPAEMLATGVIGAANLERVGTGARAPRAAVLKMDEVPQPNFDDYFTALAASPLRRYIAPGLPVETSRGCWWGAKKHCTFCGLNGGNMAFRSKSAERVRDELKTLSDRYRIRKFNVVDNILDMKYLRDLLPQLAEDDYTLFFETKANLKREQLQVIAAAGIRRLQPGIETMHDGILRLIDKGTTALQNVQLLKWARELGIFITWNFLWDIPGERDEWYGEIADWLPMISHMQPPGIDRIQFHRFSPYHQRAADFDLPLTPYPAYRSVYPVSEDDLGELAYYFDGIGRPPAHAVLAARPHLKRVIQIVGRWNRLWRAASTVDDKPVLLATRDASGLVIIDTRPGAVASAHRLSGRAARIHELCDSVTSVAALAATLSGEADDPGEDGIRAVLADLERRQLVLHARDRYLALATRDVQRIPDSADEFPGGTTDVDAWYADKLSADAGAAFSLASDPTSSSPEPSIAGSLRSSAMRATA